MAEMKIDTLHFTSPSMRSFDLKITAIIDPELDIGWISHVTVSLFLPSTPYCQKSSVRKKAKHLLPPHKDDNGHNLSVAIDLNDISSVSVSNVDCQATDEEVELTFKVLSLNPVDLPFGYCKFSLTKDETLLASLKGHFDIFPDYCDIALAGTCEATDVNFAGTAILKGVQASDHAGSWIDRAIQLFEVEIKLD
ncbi:hypothetical protein J3F84DRAFT_405855 [Trichoderma pleuroticola]